MWSDKETDLDFLGYAIHASMIKSVIREPKNLPVTIGLYGDWGSGKSSVLKILKKDIETDADLKGNTIVIEFDGWAFESFDDAKVALINGIVTKLNDAIGVGEQAKKEVFDIFSKLKKSICSMRSLIWGIKNVSPHIGLAFATHGATIIPSIIKLIDENKEQAKESLEKLLLDSNQEEAYEAVHQFRNDFEKMVKATGKDRIVVLIDDLDRCLPRHIIENLEAIKLFLDVPKVAFVIAADETIVSSAIRSELPQIYDTEISENEDKKDKKATNRLSGAEKVGRYYMEKFIQIPYTLPKLGNSEVTSYITLLFCHSLLPEESFNIVFDCYKKFCKTQKYETFDSSAIPQLEENVYSELIKTTAFVTEFAPIISTALRRNPRLIKRFLNAFELRVRLLEQIDISDAETKYALLKLMLIELNNEGLFNTLHSYAMRSNGCSEELLSLEQYAIDNSGTLPDEKWNDADILSVIKHEPKFSTVNLREIFWVSRDKLINGMNSENLIPKWIKEVVRKIVNDDNITSVMIMSQWNSIQSKMDENGIKDMIAELERELLLHPDNHSCHVAYITLSMVENRVYISYLKMLKRIDFQKLTLFSLRNDYANLLKDKQNDSEFLKILKSNSKLYRAINKC